MKINLNNGSFALVDKEDYMMLSKFRWHVHTTGYARTSTPNKIYMHRLITKANKDDICDHINGNILDNRKSNLRLCTDSQNIFNSKIRKDNKSGYKGVSWDKNRNKWIVVITANKKHVHVGRFDNKIDAAKMYNLYANKLHGEFARINNI